MNIQLSIPELELISNALEMELERLLFEEYPPSKDTEESKAAIKALHQRLCAEIKDR